VKQRASIEREKMAIDNLECHRETLYRARTLTTAA